MNIQFLQDSVITTAPVIGFVCISDSALRWIQADSTCSKHSERKILSDRVCEIANAKLNSSKIQEAFSDKNVLNFAETMKKDCVYHQKELNEIQFACGYLRPVFTAYIIGASVMSVFLIFVSITRIKDICCKKDEQN